MNLPFLRFLKRDKVAERATAAAPRTTPPIEKPASERFGKTVMPNSSRIVGLEPARNFPVPAPAAAPAPAPASTVPAAPRKISLGGSGAAVGVATSPVPELGNAERTIALQLADLVPHIPGGMLAPAEIDPHRRVLLKASEVERGMASGRPTVLLRAIYQQAPEFFASEVAAADQTEVVLPFGKVLEQFTSLQVRPDQISEQEIPEMETPFLKVTLEDSKRFGTPVTPLPKAAISQVVASEPAPVAAPAPEEIREIKPIRLSIPPQPNVASAVAPAPIRLDPSTARPAITAKVSSNGTGVPASERVPASSGPSVPTALPSPFAPPVSAAPARIAFKVSPPSNDLRELAAPSAPSLRPRAATVEFSATGPRVRLSLRDVLREIPPFQLSGPIDSVAEGAMIEFPFSIIEPQLSLGRISVSPAQFQAALPEEYRAAFKLDDPETPVALPLQEVLQNLPDDSLQLRGDQEQVEIAEVFETPFSQKAAEDAARLKVPSGPIVQSAPTSVVAQIAPAMTEPAPAAEESARKSEQASNPKSIVAEAGRLPGVSGCAVVFSDGLSLAGNLPAEYKVDALCAMAPSIMKRIGDQLAAANLGALDGMTLFCAKTPVSFFAHGNICLAALHSAGEIAAEVRLRLNATAKELARIYAQPA